MIKHVEVKTYTHKNINVTVTINYDRKHISLVESGNAPAGCSSRFTDKNYVFAKRGLEYMEGWRNILHAMEYAINSAENELKDYLAMKQKEKDDETTEILMQATKIVKNKNKK